MAMLEAAASAAARIRSPISLAALVVIALAGLAKYGFSTPQGVLVAGLAIPLLVFAAIPWGRAIEHLRLAVSVVLITLALMPVAAIALAIRLFPPQVQSDNTPVEVTRLLSAMGVSLNQGNLDAADERASEILTLDPNEWRAIDGLGQIAFYRGRYQDAARLFRKAHKKQPTSGAVMDNLADALVEIGEYQAALDLYRAAGNQTERRQYDIARVYLHMGDYQKAIDLVKVLPLDLNGGRSLVLYAAAIMGKSRSAPTQDQAVQRQQASAKLTEGFAMNPEFWTKTLVHNQLDQRESNTVVRSLLAPILPRVAADDPGPAKGNSALRIERTLDTLPLLASASDRLQDSSLAFRPDNDAAHAALSEAAGLDRIELLGGPSVVADCCDPPKRAAGDIGILLAECCDTGVQEPPDKGK